MQIDITLKELKVIAKEQGIKGYTKLSKEELIAEIAKLEMKAKQGKKEIKLLPKKEEVKELESRLETKVEKSLNNKSKDKLKKKSKDDFKINKDNFKEEKKQNKKENKSNSNLLKENVIDYISNIKEKTETDIEVSGYLDILPDGYGFLRKEMFISSDNDIYIAPHLIKKFGLYVSDYVKALAKRTEKDKFPAVNTILEINGLSPQEVANRKDFDLLTPIFPNKKFKLETESHKYTSRIIDLIAPIGKGQRGVIVSPPKSGKTTIIKDIANSILLNDFEDKIQLIILLIDERPEEVTDIAESVNAEVVASTFDEQPQNHVRVAEIVLEKAKRSVESGKDVVILLDSITRLARAYNQVIPSSGKTLSGGFDPAALYKPKRFFGSARNVKEGGSLTIIATALVDTGSRMDDVIYEEFKGTGNLEIVLDRSLAENRIYPAIDVKKSGTRRDDLLLTSEELETMNSLRRFMSRFNTPQAIEYILKNMRETKTNIDFIKKVKDDINKLGSM